MSSEPLRLEVLVGSVREGRVGPSVASWFAAEARKHADFAVGTLDLADHDLPNCLSADPPEDARRSLAELSPRLAAADVFAVVTPEYNHSFPASLKSAIDWHREEWQAKPVGLLSYGGMSGGLRATEHLRQVFGELHAPAVRNTVSFHRHAASDTGPWNDFRDGGEHEAAIAAKGLLDQLSWWGLALRDARTARPYQA